MQRPDDGDDGAANADPAKGRRKAGWFEQRWKKAGGSSLLAHLNDDLSQTADEDDSSADESEKKITKKKKKHSHEGASSDDSKSRNDVRKTVTASADTNTVEKASALLPLRPGSARKLGREKSLEDDEDDLLGPAAKVAVGKFKEG